MNYYLKVLKNYAVFSGRARRSEYWYFVLFNLIFSMVALGLDNILGTTIDFGHFYGLTVEASPGPIHPKIPFGYFYLVYGLATLLPTLSVSVRRLHDVGKSGWFLLIGLIPLVGGIWLLVLYCTDSNPGPNEYGENPKEPISTTV